MPFAIAIGAISAGTSLFSAYQSHKQAKSSESLAQQEFDQSQRQLELFERQNDQINRRFNQNYLPIEQDIARDLQDGPDFEGHANQYGNEFATQFDASAAAQERQLRQFGIRPDSQAYARATEDNAFNRAAGIADSRNRARREEEDSHFLKQTAFLSGGSNLQSQVAANYSSLYGTRLDQANSYAADANANRQNVGRSLTNAVSAGARAFGIENPLGLSGTNRVGIQSDDPQGGTSDTSGINAHNTGAALKATNEYNRDNYQ